MPNHRTSTYVYKRPGISARATVALIGLLLLAIATAIVGLWFTFHPVGGSDSPSFWHGATDTLRTVRMLGSCQ